MTSPLPILYSGNRRHLLQAAVMVLTLWVTFCGVRSAVAAAAADERQARTEAIITLMRQDLGQEALPLVRAFNRDFPGDPTMLYNQACLENRWGDPAAALEVYGQAVGAGFQDFSYAQDDPDLQGGLQNQIRRFHQADIERLADRSRQLALELAYEKSSEPLLLTHGGPNVSAPALALRWDDVGLNINLSAAAEWSALISADPLAPWNGGSGLIVTLAIPDGTSSFESMNHFMFAFGAENTAGVGGMFLVEQNRWQRVLELDPKIRVSDAGEVSLDAVIPWAAIMPFHPLVDTTLGINASLVMPHQESSLQATLLEAPDLGRPRARTRRFVPLAFATATAPDEIFLGRVSESISQDGPITLDLTAIAAEEGTGVLAIDFVDGQSNSVLPKGRLAGSIALEPGPNLISREIDFSALQTGAYLMKARLKFPSGRTATWSTTVLHLGVGWADELYDSVSRLPAMDQPTATYYLDSILAAVAVHRTRRSPGAIASTLNDIQLLIASDIEYGSILPDKGTYLLVYAGPDGQNRLCSVYLPSGWKIAAKLNPVLILNRNGEQATGIAHRLGQNYQHGQARPKLKAGQDRGFPIYLVPHLEPVGPQVNDALLAEAENCLDWARNYFGTQTASVAGIDDCGPTALQLGRSRPEDLLAVLVFAGRAFDPWPQADDAFLKIQLTPAPTAPPITWVNFEQETMLAGQAPRILAIAQDLGYPIGEVQKVRGGLNLTQAADRTLMWAEALR